MLVQKFWTSCIFIHTENLGWSINSGPYVFSFMQKIWVGPEILDQMYFRSHKNLGWSRNSGPFLFSFIQKIWVRPEILDQLLFHSQRKSGLVHKFWTSCLFRSNRKSVLVHKFWTSCIFVHRENLGWSTNSGPVVFSFMQKIWSDPEIQDHLLFHSQRKSGLVQKFWTGCIFIHTENPCWSINSGPAVFSFTQKICVSPEILEKLDFRSQRKSGLVQNSGPAVFSFIQKIWARPEIRDQSYFGSHRKSGLAHKFWTSCQFIHTENLGWSRNSGPVVFSFMQKIWSDPEILDQLYFRSHRKSVLVQKFWTSWIFVHTENLG